MMLRESRKRSAALLFALVVAVAASCSSQPAPLRVRRGASFTLLLGGEIGMNRPVGFGGAWYEFLPAPTPTPPPLIDVQRGQVEFYLTDGSQEYPLQTDLVTRSFPDPASNTGLAPGTNEKLGQLMALISIPPDLDPAAPQLLTLDARLLIPDQDPIQLPYSQELEILAGGPDDPTPPALGWANQGVTDWWTTQALYPHPKLIIDLPSPPPAMAHFVISIAAGVDLSVADVIEEQEYGRRSVIQWRVELDGASNQLVTIDYLNVHTDPGRFPGQLALVYQPGPGYTRIDDADDPGPGPGFTNPLANNFSVLSGAKFWDENGAPMGGAATLGPIR